MHDDTVTSAPRRYRDQIAVRITARLRARAERVAAAHEQHLSELIRAALAEHVGRLEREERPR